MLSCFSFLHQMFSTENRHLGVEASNANGETLMDDDDDFDDKFPPGYRFKPYDNELVVCYLQRKINKEPLPPNRIKEVELYKFNPETLAQNYRPLGENEWYFFTPRDRKYKRGTRPNRAAADGYWKATGADKRVENNDILVGFKKALVFYRGKSPKGDKTNWIMHEFRVDTPPIIRNEDMRLDDWVVCRIYKKKEQDRSRRGTSMGQEDDSIQDDQQSETEFQDTEAFDMAAKIYMPQDDGLSDMSGYGYRNQGRFYNTHDNEFMYDLRAFNNNAARLPGRTPQFSHYMGLPGQNRTWTQQTFPASNQNLNQVESSAAAAAARSSFLPVESNMMIERPTFQPMESNMKPEQFNGYNPSDYLDIPLEDSYLDDSHPPN